MSNKERVLQLIDDTAGETIMPDEWDLKMIEDAKKENDGTIVTIEEVAKDLVRV